MRSHYYWQMTEIWLPLLSRSFLDVFYFDKVEQLLFLRLWQIFQTWIKRNLLASPDTEQWTLIKPTVIRETKAIILAVFIIIHTDVKGNGDIVLITEQKVCKFLTRLWMWKSAVIGMSWAYIRTMKKSEFPPGLNMKL